MPNGSTRILKIERYLYGTLVPTTIEPPNQSIVWTTDKYGSPFRKYYGDEISLQFWEDLGMYYGAPPTNAMWSLTPGYIYRYYPDLELFEVYDNTNTLIYSQTGCTTINELNIDFAIHKSHQFQIWLGTGGKFVPWYISARLVKKEYGPSPVIKYKKELSQPYEQLPFKLINSHDAIYKAKANYHRKVYKQPKLIGVGGTDQERYADPYLGFAAQVYVDDFIPFKVIKKPILFKITSFYIRMALPWMSASIYPGIQPILRYGETQNNRPIYEPWLIQMYKLIFSHPIENDDAWGIEIIDLSPNWNY